MFKTKKSNLAVMLIVGGIISGAALGTPAYAKHHTQEAKTEAASAESAQKLALAHDDVATEQASVVSGDTAKSVKAHKPVGSTQSNYFDVEKYNFDMVGTSALTGI
ncbi:MAG: hypothetical protein P4L53_13875 [Candidatus Obscuribacterales bacterium]|nr:hypothetical protein [Candidatus Obscuribacterales bacterium]